MIFNCERAWRHKPPCCDAEMKIMRMYLCEMMAFVWCFEAGQRLQSLLFLCYFLAQPG